MLGKRPAAAVELPAHMRLTGLPMQRARTGFPEGGYAS